MQNHLILVSFLTRTAITKESFRNNSTNFRVINTKKQISKNVLPFSIIAIDTSGALHYHEL